MCVEGRERKVREKGRWGEEEEGKKIDWREEEEGEQVEREGRRRRKRNRARIEEAVNAERSCFQY